MMALAQPTLEAVFHARLQTLALTLRPGTVAVYRSATRRFLSYLRVTFPTLSDLSQIRRDPHLLGWLRSLCQPPPLSQKTRINLLLCLRRLLEDLATDGHPLAADLIRPEDFPPPPRYLPRPLSPQDDQLLQQRLRHIDDLFANALLLTRLTGLRIGECIHLSLDCLRQLGPDDWAVHVPLGKLHTERFVPADADIRRIVARILALRALQAPACLAPSQGFLLPRPGTPGALYQKLVLQLTQAAQQAGCSGPVTPHRLRHTFASEMLRLGVSLPALMRLLGHNDIRMTMRYVEVTQQDLQREFHAARQKGVSHSVPVLLPRASAIAGVPGVLQSLAATRHLLETYRRQLADEKTRRTVHRLDQRLLAVASRLKNLDPAKK